MAIFEQKDYPGGQATKGFYPGGKESIRRKFGGKNYKLVTEGQDKEFAIQKLQQMGYDNFHTDERGRLWARKSTWEV